MKTLALLIALLSGSTRLSAADPESALVVHEWGTFTSVQGGDGTLLPWQPFITPDLPAFVYDWNKPGMGRATPAALLFSKGGIRSLQRMETPVLYFYSDRELTADVTVKFPKGFITEWYPQAAQIDFENQSASASKRSLMPTANAPDRSAISWRNLKLIPAHQSNLAQRLPQDSSDNHYYAARETDANFVQLANGGTNGTTTEIERLLFYRGTGNFATPLRLTIGPEDTLSVVNTGSELIADLFLLEVQAGTANWTQLRNLAPKQSQAWRKLLSANQSASLTTAEFSHQLGSAMEQALVRAGLFPKEAAAMVKTWQKSWFAEEGVRLLYLLPRTWTDETLPLTMSPRPSKLERVMVGRAEVITPALQKELAALIVLNQKNDSAAAAKLGALRKRLGRFHGAAYQLAQQLLAVPNKPVASAATN